MPPPSSGKKDKPSLLTATRWFLAWLFYDYKDWNTRTHSSETSVDFKRAWRSYIPEDRHLEEKIIFEAVNEVVWYEALKPLTMKSISFWDVTPCRLICSPTFQKNLLLKLLCRNVSQVSGKGNVVLPAFCSYFLGLLIDPEDEDTISSRNVRELLPDFTAWPPKRQYSSI
jgi:hypothetical protein